MLEVYILEALKDNYVYVIRDAKTDTIGVVDPSESEPVLEFLNENSWPLHFILNTHHHDDHVGGNLSLSARFNCPIYCSQYDKKRIPGATHALIDGEILNFGSYEFKIITVPGHTLGAIAYHCEKAKLVFTGDTLFTLGCGRIFEGTPEMLWKSLKRLVSLPDNTEIYSGHEYGLQNSGFALSLNPQHAEIKEFFQKCKSFRISKERSVPSILSEEKRLNPFLKARNLEEFAKIRKLKDDFRLENAGSLG